MQHVAFQISAPILQPFLGYDYRLHLYSLPEHVKCYVTIVVHTLIAPRCPDIIGNQILLYVYAMSGHLLISMSR
jgi:hypothetical protein